MGKRGLGLEVTMPNGRPHVVGVVAERSGTTVIARETFRHTATAQADFPQQLASLETALESTIGGFSVDAVVVRTFDHSPRPRRESEVAGRYSVEGVLLAACRRHVQETNRL